VVRGHFSWGIVRAGTRTGGAGGRGASVPRDRGAVATSETGARGAVTASGTAAASAQALSQGPVPTGALAAASTLATVELATP
jgi:hypothetical protein